MPLSNRLYPDLGGMKRELTSPRRDSTRRCDHLFHNCSRSMRAQPSGDKGITCFSTSSLFILGLGLFPSGLGPLVGRPSRQRVCIIPPFEPRSRPRPPPQRWKTPKLAGSGSALTYEGPWKSSISTSRSPYCNFISQFVSSFQSTDLAIVLLHPQSTCDLFTIATPSSSTKLSFHAVLSTLTTSLDSDAATTS